MADLSRPEAMASIDKTLPIYLISGALDPVSKQGLGIEKLKCALIQAGIKRVDVRLYQEARHEILNETNRAEVFKDLLYWLAALKSEL
jgi:alpha-beta hydrolase superfamily lysophospholipase